MKYYIYILISFLILSCSKRKKYTEKELEKTLLEGDFIFCRKGDKFSINNIVKKPLPKKDKAKFNPNINKDSLFHVITKKINPSKIREFTKIYNNGNKTEREFLLMMFSIPKSSKNKQIDNLETNNYNIKKLINEYSKLVPDSLSVSIEFNPKNVIFNNTKSIDLDIYSKNKNGKSEQKFRESNLPHNSKILLKQIRTLGWNKKTLMNIENLLKDANCNSIRNGDITTVGFARNGMGKYSYKFFKKDLNKEEQAKYNDGCLNVYYKKNIVLEFTGGAIGQQCFEK